MKQSTRISAAASVASSSSVLAGGEDAEVSGYNHSSTTDENVSSAFSKSSKVEEQIQIANAESRYVCYLRALLFVVLFLLTGSISAAVYFYTRNSEVEEFKSSFEEMGFKVTDAFVLDASRRLVAIESLASAITSTALARGMAWPNVTLDDFERRSKYLVSYKTLSCTSYYVHLWTH
jgi:hypothetical protein